MKVKDLMTANPAICTPQQSLQEAAKLMDEHDCGCLPVLDSRGGAVVGVLTDRDIAVRAVGVGKSPDTQVREIMSADLSCCTIDDSIDDVERIMSERQVRRVPVIDSAGRCVGVIAQADLARARSRVGDREVARLIEKVSEPNEEPRREADVGRRPSTSASDSRASM